MNLREITIGRAKDCDIYLDDRCRYASSHHAIIYNDGGQLMYRDTSTNGTLINNINIKKRAVPINYGDTIMLAGQYPLNWTQLLAYFPEAGSITPARPLNKVNPISPRPTPPPIPNASRNLTKWNWGAFGLYPIWGFFNGCWWAILIAIFGGAFFGIIINIIFGIYGTRWAWNNGTWNSYEEFEKSQESWSMAGIICFCLQLLAFFIFIAYQVSLLSSFH